MNESLKIMSWNIKSGGFESYNPGLEAPARETKIQAFVNDTHYNRGVEAVSLTDALLWDEVYGGDQGIASHLGYGEARFQPLNDERLNREAGSGIGLVFATDARIEQSRALDLESRQGLNAILDVGKYGLQIATVYLDDLYQDVREKQIRALANDLEKDIPTIIVGDFNMLRPEMRGASFSIQLKDLAIRSLARFVPNKNLRTAMVEMNRRTGVPLIESFGYTDADSSKMRPTAPTILPAFGIDYIFHNNDVMVANLEARGSKEASDHLALTADLRF
jgi:endonuclease/exonuclease/phosphatase family metal-dependent hydrolase